MSLSDDDEIEEEFDEEFDEDEWDEGGEAPPRDRRREP